MQNLSKLIAISPELDRPITGLALDSRLVQPGNLFFAFPGVHQDGRQFIADAIAKGAQAVLAESPTSDSQMIGNVPVISMPSLQQHVSHIAATFFENPASALSVIGVTGTNGKTSCSHFLASVLQSLAMPCGIIGTLGNGMFGKLTPSGLTTPDAISLQAALAEFVKQGAKAVSMEVSSHSLEQGRVKAIPFDVGIFTNLTRDHLDYHGDMRSYGAAKKKLFDNPLLQSAVINADDPFGRELIQTLHNKKSIFSYSTNDKNALIYAENVQLSLSGINAVAHTPWGTNELFVPLIGQFNLSNTLAVLTTLCLLEVSLDDALNALAKIQAVPGRMQRFGGGAKPLVIVDYAHTPDALESVLIALRQHCQGRVWCLFGCGGDRDKGKRPIMAAIAERHADHVMITNDNPRHEDPGQIIAEMMQGFLNPSRIIVQQDRSKAIQDIIQCAMSGDCVLIAGKGAETYQQIGDTKIPFSDAEKVTNALMAN